MLPAVEAAGFDICDNARRVVFLELMINCFQYIAKTQLGRKRHVPKQMRC